MLEELDKWLDPWRIKVWDALYRREEAEARSLVERSRRTLENAGFAPAEHEAAALCLDFTAFQVDESFAADHEVRAGCIEKVLEQFAPEPQHEIARVMRSRILITLLCWAQRYEVLEAREQQIRTLLHVVPESDLDHQNWTYLATWAFAARDAAILGRAYRKFLTEPFDFMVDFSRQRLKVMLQVLEGRGEPREIVKLIDLLPHLNHVAWLRQHLVPVLVDTGLWSPELNARLVAREHDIVAQGPKPPPREHAVASSTRLNI